MRKRSSVIIFRTPVRFYSDGEYRWKSRDLNEKRELAVKYMGDIKLRTPIHESVRKKIILDRNKWSDVELSSLLETNQIDTDGEGVDVDDFLHSILDNIDECIDDTLKYLSDNDLHFLSSEFVDGNIKDQEDSIKRWLKLRRETSDYQNYLSIPESERTSWSAWYLRNVKAPKDE